MSQVGASASGEVLKLGGAYLVSGVLNGAKFFLLPIALTAHELDVLAICLLLAVSLAQVPGEAIANHQVVAGPAATRTRAAVLIVAALLFSLAAVFPQGTASLVAGGFDLSGDDRATVALFCVAGLAWVVQWTVAGRLQARGDLAGLRLVALSPNVALLAALAVSLGRLVALAVGVLVVMAGLTTVALWLGRRRAAGEDASSHNAAWRSSIVALLAAGLASQANLLFVRVAAGDLGPGALGGLYVAIGIAILPLMAGAGAWSAAWLPEWAAGAPRLEVPRAATLVRVSVLAGAGGAALFGVVVAVLSLPLADELIDPPVGSAITDAAPWLALGVPIGACAWMLRGWLLATGRPWPYVGAALAGSSLVLLASAAEHSVAAVAAGFAASPLPIIVAGLAVASRDLHRRSATASVDGAPRS